MIELNKKYKRVEWKDIPGLSGYQTSEDGRARHGKNQIAIRKDNAGVPYVQIRAQRYELSTLVWKSFCGPIPDGYVPVPFHLNGDYQDCSIDNLAIERGREAELADIRRLMGCGDYWRIPNGQPAWRPAPDPSLPSGRVKLGGNCARCMKDFGRFTPQSPTGDPDDFTAVWGVGNRVCLVCHPNMRD